MKLVRKRMKFFYGSIFSSVYVDTETGKIYFDNNNLAELFGCTSAALNTIINTSKVTGNVFQCIIDSKSSNVKLYTEQDMYNLIAVVIDNEKDFEQMCDSYYLMMYAWMKREEDMKAWRNDMKKQNNNEKILDLNKIKKSGLKYYDCDLKYVYDLFLLILKYDIKNYFKLILKLMQLLKKSDWEEDKAKLFETALLYENNVKLFMNDFDKNMSANFCMSDFYKALAADNCGEIPDDYLNDKQKITLDKCMKTFKAFLISTMNDIDTDDIENGERKIRPEITPISTEKEDVSEKSEEVPEIEAEREQEEWFSTKQVADILGITASIVGIVAKRNNLRTDGYFKTEGKKFFYNKKAVDIMQKSRERNG